MNSLITHNLWDMNSNLLVETTQITFAGQGAFQIGVGPQNSHPIIVSFTTMLLCGPKLMLENFEMIAPSSVPTETSMKVIEY
jgi:hypothetical protein